MGVIDRAIHLNSEQSHSLPRKYGGQTEIIPTPPPLPPPNSPVPRILLLRKPKLVLYFVTGNPWERGARMETFFFFFFFKKTCE